MTQFSEDARIVDESTRIRLAELEVEKEKIKSSSNPNRIRFNFFWKVSIAGSITLLGLALTARSCIETSTIELTKRQPEITLQIDKSEEEQTKRALEATKQAEIASNLTLKQAELAAQKDAEETEKLKVILDLTRGSKSDELTLKAIDLFITASDRCSSEAQ